MVLYLAQWTTREVENIENKDVLQALLDMREGYRNVAEIEPGNQHTFSKHIVQVTILKVLMEINEKLDS